MFRQLLEKIIGHNIREKEDEKRITHLKKSLKKNIETFSDIFSKDETFIQRDFQIGLSNIECTLFYIDEMIDKRTIDETILKPILDIELIDKIDGNLVLGVKETVLTNKNISLETSIDKLIEAILSGDTVILLDGYDSGLIVNTKGWPTRAITKPETEQAVRGPRDGFTESLPVNISLIRRRIKDKDLKFEFQKLGERTKTSICICYIKGLASKKILRELKERLDKIEIDGILESGYIEELIKDSPLSPFKTIGSTERPDVTAAKLLEGKIALICDGTPFVLTIPYLFQEYFQANEDYYTNYIFASMNRMLRYISFFITTSVPAIYLGLTTFHQEMLPTPLMLSITSAREGVPFPTVVEVLIMGLVFEIIREGGVRLPSPVGEAVSIVGAIVLGEAAVVAKLVSAPIVIVIALTGITTFLIPGMLGPIIVIRLVFVVLTSILGLYGYIFAVIGLFILLMSMRSFGVPYLLNLGAIEKRDIKDTAVRAPWWWMTYRSKISRDQKREGMSYNGDDNI